MRKMFIFISSLMLSLVMYGQTVLINPAQEGGFELGPDFASNGWTLDNGTQVNQWFVGTVPGSPNNNSAYVSNDAGVSWAYTNSTAAVVHFYRDINFPAGETDIQLTFLLRGIGESSYDRLRIYLVPTTTTPVAGTELAIGNQVGLTNYNFQGVWIKVGLQIPASAAGTTQRLVFSWRNDGSGGTPPPVSIDNIALVSQTPYTMAGIYTIDNTLPTAGVNFNSFNDAILSLNSAVIAAPITFIVTSGQQFVEILPIITATGTIANTITFTKSGIVNPIILSGGFSSTTDAVVAIRGGDYFTFNGFDLGLADPSQNTVENGYYVINASATDGAQFNTFTNTNIALNRTNTTSRGVYQNVATTPTNATGANSNNIYSNINVSNSYNGIVCNGNATYPDLSTAISNCIIGADLPNDIGNGSSAISGIRITSGRDVMVYENIVRNLTMTGSTNVFGIFMENIQGNSQIYKNKVYNLTSTNVSTSAFLQGIRADVTATNQASVHNNVVYGFTHAISSPSSTMVARGIAANVTGTGTVGITYNSVHIHLGAAATSTALWTGGGTHAITNNVFANSSTAGATSNRFSIFRSGTGVLLSNYNNLYIEPGTNNWVGFYTANQLDLAAWQTASLGDLNSINVNPIFTGSPDLMPSNPAMNNLATVVPITDDITGALRHPSTPDMGAYEFTPPSCLQPSGLTATGITNSSAILGWTSSASLWNVEVGLPGFTPGTGASVVNVTGTTNNPWQATGLSASTSYQFYVQADCGGGDLSAWAGPFAFATQTVVPAPYFEGFPVTATPAGYGITGWTIGSTRGVLGNPANNIYKNMWSSAPTGTFTTVNVGPLSAGMLLTFDYIVANYSSPYAPPAAGSGGFSVEISTDFGSTYTLLETVPNNGVAGYQPKQYDLNAYNGQIVKLRFSAQWISGDYDIAFDNISIAAPPACPNPTVLTATAITQTTADLGWTSSASLWNVEVGLPGFTPGTGASVVNVTGTTNNPWQATGLTLATFYEFYVQADCGSGNLSTWVGPFLFATACPTTAYTLPFFENFEGVVCWSTWNQDGGGVNWTLATGQNHTPSGSVAAVHNWGASGYAESGWIYTPDIILPAGGMYELSFWSFIVDATYYGNNAVMVSTDDFATFDTIWSPTSVPESTWSQTILDLSAYEGETISIGFRYQGTWAHRWWLDDVLVREVVPATITPITATYDIAAPAAVTTTVTWNDATSITTIVDDQTVPVTLIENTHYTLVGNTLTILDAYLSTVLLAATDDVVLTISFNIGVATFTITAIETAVIDATINPIAATYDITIPADVATTVTWNDATSITTIFDDQALPFELVANTHYTLVGNTLTILDAYLSTVLLAATDDVVLTISFDAGADATFTITAIETVPVVVVAHWNFEDAVKKAAIIDNATFLSAPYTADNGIVANVNVAPISIIGGSTFSAWVLGVTGDAPNAVNWDTGADTKYWMTTITTTGYENLKLSSVQRSSNTGPRDMKVQYSTDGLAWTDVPMATLVIANNWTSGVLDEVELPAACENQPTLMLRWIMTTDVAVNASPVGAAGTNRIDEILITGTDVTVSVPEITTDVKVYPNPSNGQFVIESGANWTMMVYDITGRMVTSQQITVGSNDVNLLNQPSGLYFIRLFNKEQSHTIRIVIE